MSDNQKKTILDFVEALHVNNPSALYLAITNHILQHGKQEPEKEITLHPVPEAVCTSCE